MPPADRVRPMGFAVLGLAAALAVTACTSPPDKELNQAVGAIEAARAAGAEQYAAEDFTAAVGALERARTAVDQRDYRLALNDAIDARERAGDAARAAAAHRAEAQSRADVLVAQLAEQLGHLRADLAAAEDARVPASDVADARQTADRAGPVLQEAREAIARQEYVPASTALEALAEALVAASADVAKAAASKTPRRRP